MANDRPSDIKTLWTSQETEGFTMSLEEIRAGASKLQRKVRFRNLLEYATAAFIVPIFALYVVVLPGIVAKIGSVMIILGTLFVVWQLHRRGSARAAPLGESALAHMEHYREELARQRDALRSIATWYLAPFVPGFVVLLVGITLQAPSLHRALPYVLVVGTVGAATFVGIWLLNRWGASRLQQMIDALKQTGTR